VLEDGRAVRPASPPRALHEVRIACKKLRYLMEFFRSLFPAEAIAPLIKALKAFQDNLGEHQDLAVQQDQLRGFERAMAREGTLPAETRAAMEELVEHLATRQAEVRRQFAERFAGFSGAETRAAFRALFRDRNPPLGGSP
jgi:CHAD domain-containing protein